MEDTQTYSYIQASVYSHYPGIIKFFDFGHRPVIEVSSF
jgi:hypothetical protein